MNKLHRSASQDYLVNPSRLLKQFSGISKISKKSCHRYDIEMIPKKDYDSLKLLGKQKDINRLFLLFGYNGLKNNEITINEYVPIPLSISIV